MARAKVPRCRCEALRAAAAITAAMAATKGAPKHRRWPARRRWPRQSRAATSPAIPIAHSESGGDVHHNGNARAIGGMGGRDWGMKKSPWICKAEMGESASGWVSLDGSRLNLGADRGQRGPRHPPGVPRCRCDALRAAGATAGATPATAKAPFGVAATMATLRRRPRRLKAATSPAIPMAHSEGGDNASHNGEARRRRRPQRRRCWVRKYLEMAE